jgi:hypothetical protein
MIGRYRAVINGGLMVAVVLLMAYIGAQLDDEWWRGGVLALLVLLSALLGALTMLGLVLEFRLNQVRRYRLAWLSARRRALYAVKAFRAEAKAVQQLEAKTHQTLN